MLGPKGVEVSKDNSSLFDLNGEAQALTTTDIEEMKRKGVVSSKQQQPQGLGLEGWLVCRCRLCSPDCWHCCKRGAWPGQQGPALHIAY